MDGLFLSLFSLSLKALDRELPVMEPYFVQNPNLSGSGPGLRVTWLGHATVLVEIDGVNVLTDPIFSQRASPIQYMGPKRFRGPPCTVEQVPIYTYIYFCLLKIFIYSSTFKVLLLLSCQQLPRIDAVVISHSHYDHLDAGSVASLNARFGGELRWYVRWISGPQYYFHSCHMFTSHCRTVCPLVPFIRNYMYLFALCVSGSCQWVWWTGWWRWAVRMWWSWTGGRRTVSQVMMMSRLFAHPRSTGANAQHGMITK